MEVTIIITAEVPDSVFDMFGADAVARAFRQQVNSERPNFLPDLVASYGVTVEVPESNAEPLSAQLDRAGYPKVQNAVGDRPAARKPHATPTDGERRIGRPKRIDDYVAADGGPVTEWGPRSVESLKAQGIKVYRPKSAGKTQPEPQPEPEDKPTTRSAPKTARVPVVKRR